jgi:hypothetical protein
MARDWVIKSISITADDAKIAARVGNLSKFTRECLRRWSAWSEGEGKHAAPNVFTRKGACPPSSSCIVCWPGGAPTMHDWDRYLGVDPERRNTANPDPFVGSATYHGPEVGDLEWLRSRVPETFTITDIESQGNEPAHRSQPAPVPQSFIGKLLNLLQK